MLKIFNTLVVVLLVFSYNMVIAQSEKEAVIATVQKFFSAMSARDTSATQTVLLHEGQYFSVKENSSQILIRKTTHGEYLSRLSASNENWIEKN